MQSVAFGSRLISKAMDSKIIVRARLHSSIRNSGPVSFAISIDCSTTIRAVKELLLQKAQKAPGAPEWNAPSSPSAFIMRLNDTVPLVNEDLLASDTHKFMIALNPTYISVQPPPTHDHATFQVNFSSLLQLSAVLLYPEMRKISAQEEEEEIESFEEPAGSSSELARTKSSEKKPMTQIPLTILPCSSTVSL